MTCGALLQITSANRARWGRRCVARLHGATLTLSSLGLVRAGAEAYLHLTPSL